MTKRFVVANSIKVMKRKFLGTFPEGPEKITDKTIINALKAEKNNDQQFLVFSDFDSAKQYADEKTDSENNTDSAIPFEYRPIVEVTLKKEDELITLSNQQTCTKPANIKLIHSYFYRAGSVNQSVQKENPIDMDNLPTEKISCLVM